MDLTANPSMNALRTAFLQQGGDAELFDTLLGDAQFALAEVVPFLTRGPVLEIGTGSGLIAAQLRQMGYDVSGMEPYSDGFTNAEVISRLASQLANPAPIERCGIETFTSHIRFERIYSINVFEHLKDWREGIRKAVSLLTPDGKLLLLCPNYSFPYEPHFHLPILFNKKITETVFRKSIERFEKETDARGMWKDLGFLTHREVVHFARDQNLDVSVDKTILHRMLGRMDADPHFDRRHGLVGKAARLAVGMGLHKLYTRLPTGFQPYMKIVISQKRIDRLT